MASKTDLERAIESWKASCDCLRSRVKRLESTLAYYQENEEANYRRLEKGEVIQADDQIFDDDCEQCLWLITGCAGGEAPDPRFIAHRQYRRKTESK
jgi:hypothetical protein